MPNPKLFRLLLGFLFCLGSSLSFSQSLPSSELYHELLKIKETKRVLYVAAHPDDENTRLIAYLANEELAQVAYLSLTRGDGGQNLIGPELGIGLGQIRTQELLKARETDGGRQFFTRAKDFGYSKNPDETLQNWEREKILSDVVWVIRKFRPDIIITRFNTIPGVTHGHHTTSAILAEEAFEKAADPQAFSDQLDFVEPWQAKRIFWNAYNFRGEFEPEEGKQYYAFPTGDFNPLLGETYSQIAADSRTMHKSQGFGSTAGIGAADDHIQFVNGQAMKQHPFEGIEDKWESIEGGEAIRMKIDQAIADFDFLNPEKNVPALLEVKASLKGIMDSNAGWLQEKKEALDQLILASLGIEIEFNARQETAFPGSQVSSTLVFNNPSTIPVENLSVHVGQEDFNTSAGQIVGNQPYSETIQFEIKESMPYSQPYWLEKYVDGPIYPVEEQELIGQPFNDPSIQADLSFTIADERFELAAPLYYKYNDQVDGEVKQPFVIIPEIDLSLSKETVFLLEKSDPTLVVTVHFNQSISDGSLSFEGIDEGQFSILKVEDNPAQKQRIYTVEFSENGSGKKIVKAQYKAANGKVYDQISERIGYKHIPNLTYFQPADVALIQEDWEISGDKIGYVPGAGDEVPQVLHALGYEVISLGEGDFSLENLSQYKTILIGIRAYNVNQLLAENQASLLGYVRAGGNLIVQYNTSSPLLTTQIGPYPFTITRDRVAVETASVKADYSHPLLQGPNQMRQEDFDNWIQERGLYFAGDLAPEYSTPLQMNDPGEDIKTGSLIYATYGEGTFVYTGLSFFRELPAAVPGAIKLFINLIEQ